MVQIARPAPFSNAPTDDAIDFNRRVAARLMQQGTSTEPVGHWTAALARALQGASGSMWNDQARQGEQDAEASVQAALSGKMDPKQLMMNPRTRGIGLQMWQSQQADARAAARGEKDQYREVGNTLLRIGPNGQPQVVYTAPKEKTFAERWMEQRQAQGQGGGPAPQGGPQPVAPGYQPIPQQGGPRIQPQSNLAPEVMPGGVTRVSDPQGMPQQPTAPAAPAAQPRMVDVPMFGRMTENEARDLAFGMMSNPREATMGRAILDLVGTGQTGAGLPKTTENALGEKILNTTESLARLNAIKQQFRPEFQQIENRLGYAWTELLSKSRSGQARITPEMASNLSAFSAFRADAIDNMNNYIKEITGAAMTIQEAGRILKGMPNAGEGILDGDGPISFQSKMNAAIRRSQLALARYNYIRKNGFDGQPVTGPLSVDGKDTELGRRIEGRLPLEKMEQFIQQRTDAIVQDITSKNPGIGVDQLKPVIRQRLRAEFGIDA